MASVKIFGINVVLGNMARRKAEIAAGAAAGLKLAGLELQRDSQSHVPVEFGQLKSSAYTRSSGMGFDTVVEVGYTAAYAGYVHELVAMKLKGLPRPSGRGLFWDPQGQAYAKFLEEPMNRLGPVMIRIVHNAAKLKP